MFVKRETRHVVPIVGVALLLALIVPGLSHAELFGFTAITSNSGLQGSVAQQLSVEVTPYGTDDDQVLFTFGNYLMDPYNAGTEVPSEIKSVHFEDGALLGIATVINTTGEVEFIAPDNPDAKNLPGASDFYTSAHFWATMDNGLGVDPGESLGIVFDLQAGLGFDDVITAIQLGFEEPNPSWDDYAYGDENLPATLRIGVHVGSIGGNDGDSDSFIMTPTPAAMILGMLGLSVAGVKLRRFA